MEHFLICGNPACRFVLDLQEVRKPLRRSEWLLKECPECGSQWSATCPFCTEPLSVIWRGHHALCARCHRQFHAPAAA
jgi:hypothetical protein